MSLFLPSATNYNNCIDYFQFTTALPLNNSFCNAL